MEYIYKTEVDAKPLSLDEQIELIQRYQHGDEEAGRMVVDSILRLVIMQARLIAEKHKLPWDRFSDLVHEGVVACYESMLAYDVVHRRVKLWSYAKSNVYRKMDMFCVLNSIVYVPYSTAKLARRACCSQTANDEISEFTKGQALANTDGAYYIEDNFNAEEYYGIMEEPPDENKAWFRERLGVAFDRLPTTDKLILTFRYYDGLSYKDMARMGSTTKSNISNKIRSALDKLHALFEKVYDLPNEGRYTEDDGGE